jgi:hypothetical protein
MREEERIYLPWFPLGDVLCDDEDIGNRHARGLERDRRVVARGGGADGPRRGGELPPWGELHADDQYERA